MGRYCLALVGMLAALGLELSSMEGCSRTVSAKELDKRPPIGALGLPLGTFTEIWGKVIAVGEDMKEEQRYELAVDRVNGRELKPPVQIAFEKPGFIEAAVAADPFALYRLKNGKEKEGGLGRSDIEELEKGYVGKRVHLLGYETGEFSGVPVMPEHLAIWQDHGFGFSTRFFVVGEKL